MTFSEYWGLRSFLSFGQIFTLMPSHAVYMIFCILILSPVCCVKVYKLIVRRNKSRKFVLLIPVVSVCMAFVVAYAFAIAMLFFLGPLVVVSVSAFAWSLIFWLPFFFPLLIIASLLLTALAYVILRRRSASLSENEIS